MSSLPRWHETIMYLLILFVDRISGIHSLKEQYVTLDDFSSRTRDNKRITVKSTLAYKIVDPYSASYAVANIHYTLQKTVLDLLARQFETRNHPKSRIVLSKSEYQRFDQQMESTDTLQDSAESASLSKIRSGMRSLLSLAYIFYEHVLSVNGGGGALTPGSESLQWNFVGHAPGSGTLSGTGGLGINGGGSGNGTLSVTSGNGALTPGSATLSGTGGLSL
ncbi:hypothetical protein FXO38_10225 [Capsicum annuum]|nr:hypothetical protein FXO38_10225 [Capsicum annuum]